MYISLSGCTKQLHVRDANKTGGNLHNCETIFLECGLLET